MSGSETDRAARAVPRLHVVTDDRVLARADFLDLATRVAHADPRVAVHLRGPGTDGRTLHRLAAELRRRTAAAPGLLVVNDRVDVALAVGADGVQLSQRGLRPYELPEGASRLRIGVSVHGPADRPGADTVLGGVDWWIVGTIFPTPSHPGRAGAGASRVAEFVESGRGPTIAIGGITPGRVEPVLAAGAHGVAVLRGVWDAADPVAAVRRYLSTFNSDVNSDPSRGGKTLP